MQCDSSISPHLLDRATQGDQAALSALICMRKERVYQLAVALRGGALGSEADSDLADSMEELADACARGSDLTCPPAGADPHYDSWSPSRATSPERARGSGRPVFARHALLHRWHLVHALCGAVVSLTREQRAVLVLVDMERLESDQVAWHLGLSEGETRERLLAARAHLRASLLTGQREDRQSA